MPNQPLKILFAPHEIGGQMQLMAEELRRRGHFATSASYNQEWFGHVNDINFNLSEVRGSLKKHSRMLSFSLWAAQNYDIFHFFWGESLYGLDQFPHLDLPLLRWLGKKIFVHFRGLDLVDLKYFDYLRARTAGDDAQEPTISRPDQSRSLGQWRKYAHKLLISEPDLLRVAPEALLVQQAIDLGKWRPERAQPKSNEDGIIRIVHAPSSRRKKGTEFVEAAVAGLKSLGYWVELILIENIPFDEVKALYEMADIGVDQVLYGWYGKVSIELMALGRPVICYIDDQWHPYRPDLPIVNANPKTLVEQLLRLIKDANLRKELGEAGQAYVARYHDVRVIIDQCLDIYRMQPEQSPGDLS
jgi:glycosyltransferase involved in cell wall biosynthesis